MGSLDAYVVCPPGVEAVTAAELRGLGVECTEEGTGGLAVDVSLTTLYRLALQLRTASRILVRLARFRARDFQTLERHAARLTWDRFSRPGDPIRIQASSKKSRLYHQRAIVQRFSDAARAAGQEGVLVTLGVLGRLTMLRLARDQLREALARGKEVVEALKQVLEIE